MKKPNRIRLNAISKLINIFGIAILISGLMMSFVNQPVSAVQETCPDGGEWVKVDNLTGKSYTYQAPAGKEIVEWCYKSSTSVIKGIVDPAMTSYTVSSTVENQNGQVQDISHASLKLQLKPSATVTGTSTLVPAITSTPDPTQTQEDKKVTICHAAGLEGTTKYVVLNLSYNAVFNNQGGHFNEMGTPMAGHEQDFLILDGEDLLRCQDVETQTPTPTVTVTETPEGTITVTPSATVSPTTTVTPQSFFDLEISYVCRITEMDWIVNNPNSFDVEFQWVADPVESAALKEVNIENSIISSVRTAALIENGIAIAPANDVPLVFFTSTAGSHLVRISYVLPGSDLITLELSNGNDFCRVVETPDPVSTPVPTLQVPVSQSSNVLIPVTGMDLSGLSNSAKNGIRSFLINAGLVLIGVGMVLQGLNKK